MLLGKWNVEVHGQEYVVSIERAETGKDVVRVNGRIAAKPLSPEEKDRGKWNVEVHGQPRSQ